jgi:hypothetical protein
VGLVRPISDLGTSLRRSRCTEREDRTTKDSTDAVFSYFSHSWCSAFDNIDADGKGWSDERKQLWWDDLQEHASLAPRGAALLKKLSVLSASR